jgi:predicted transcriptional regulator
MRMHIELDDELVRRIDDVAGSRGRSRFVRKAIEQLLEQEMRWTLIRSVVGSIADGGHEWDRNASDWVRQQRHGDPRRVG